MAKHRKPDDGMEEAKFCDKCSTRNGPTAKYCHSCGNLLPEKKGGTAKVVPKGKHKKPEQ